MTKGHCCHDSAEQPLAVQTGWRAWGLQQTPEDNECTVEHQRTRAWTVNAGELGRPAWRGQKRPLTLMPLCTWGRGLA